MKDQVQQTPPVNEGMTRRNILKTFGASAAVVGGGSLLEACSAPDYGEVRPEIVKASVQKVGLQAIELFENGGFEWPTIRTSPVERDKRTFTQFTINYYTPTLGNEHQHESKTAETRHSVMYEIPTDEYKRISQDENFKNKKERWEAMSDKITAISVGEYNGNSDSPIFSNSMTQDARGNWTNESSADGIIYTTDSHALGQVTGPEALDFPLSEGRIKLFEAVAAIVINPIKEKAGRIPAQVYPPAR